MKLISTLTLTATLLALASSANALTGGDSFNSNDDAPKNILAFTAIGAISRSQISSPELAFGAAMIPGVLKELSDRNRSNHVASWQDLAAYAIGAALGVAGTSFYLSYHKEQKSLQLAYRIELP